MHFTDREIHGQYEALARTLDCVNACWDDVKRLIDRKQPPVIVFLGCGSSLSVAKSLALAAQMHMKMPAVALPAGDYLLHSGSYAGFLHGALVVAVSRSGSTTELVAAVERMCGELDAAVVSLCAVEGSPLSKFAGISIGMPWCFDSSVCQTRTVSCLYLAGMELIARLAGDDKLREGLARAVTGGPAYMGRVEADLKAVASHPWTDAVVLADAELAGIAEEGALAFCEICRRPGSFHHMLDVRHGPMVLIGPHTLVIAAVAEANQYELALLGDVAKTGAELIVYSDIPLDFLPDGALNLSFGRSLPHAARGLPLILIAQLVAYHRAVADGVDPDKPEGLEPWIRL